MKVIKKIRSLFHIHKWIYWVDKDYLGINAAWNRGCYKCGKKETAVQTGNSFLYSEHDAKTRLIFKTKDKHLKESVIYNQRINKLLSS